MGKASGRQGVVNFDKAMSQDTHGAPLRWEPAQRWILERSGTPVGKRFSQVEHLLQQSSRLRELGLGRRRDYSQLQTRRSRDTRERIHTGLPTSTFIDIQDRPGNTSLASQLSLAETTLPTSLANQHPSCLSDVGHRVMLAHPLTPTTDYAALSR